ncbi:MAG: Holliday junction ATP-dependent DNA helicase RuvA [Actinobacteria bacterium ADurb.Bin346]|nr:MAG: Holliday junction ATP-dependent DNA helicase RuvA [Actinobacteria bacterium ADurb.Bin346]
MIARLTGMLAEKLPASIIIETSGLGFEVLISSRTFEKLPTEGETVSLDIHTHVREDDIKLVGFLNPGEKALFLKLLQVSGISIKTALSALSIYSVEELKRIIISREVDLIQRIPGIGKKLAERMIVELKDKFEEGSIEGLYGGVFIENKKVSEIRQALKILGYNNAEINDALKKVDIDTMIDKKTEDILKLVLKEM